MEMCPQTKCSSVKKLENDHQSLERKHNFSGQKIVMFGSIIYRFFFFNECLVLTYFFGFDDLVFLSNRICYFMFISKQDNDDSDNN